MPFEPRMYIPPDSMTDAMPDPIMAGQQYAMENKRNPFVQIVGGRIRGGEGGAGPPSLIERIQQRIARDPKLAAIAAEPTEAAKNPFVQKSLQNAQQRSQQRIADIIAKLPPNLTSADIYRAITGLEPPK